MALTGKLSTELVIQTPAAKFFHFITKQLHQIQNVAERVHATKVHQGDWHSIGSVKHWTYLIDGKVTTCKENIEAIDENNKSVTYNLFDGDLSQQYKIFKFKIQVIDKDDGGAIVIWAIEYEKVNEDIEPPYGYLDYVTKITKDIVGHLVKA